MASADFNGKTYDFAWSSAEPPSDTEMQQLIAAGAARESGGISATPEPSAFSQHPFISGLTQAAKMAVAPFTGGGMVGEAHAQDTAQRIVPQSGQGLRDLLTFAGLTASAGPVARSVMGQASRLMPSLAQPASKGAALGRAAVRPAYVGTGMGANSASQGKPFGEGFQQGALSQTIGEILAPIFGLIPAFATQGRMANRAAMDQNRLLQQTSSPGYRLENAQNPRDFERLVTGAGGRRQLGDAFEHQLRDEFYPQMPPSTPVVSPSIRGFMNIPGAPTDPIPLGQAVANLRRMTQQAYPGGEARPGLPGYDIRHQRYLGSNELRSAIRSHSGPALAPWDAAHGNYAKTTTLLDAIGDPRVWEGGRFNNQVYQDIVRRLQRPELERALTPRGQTPSAINPSPDVRAVEESAFRGPMPPQGTSGDRPGFLGSAHTYVSPMDILQGLRPSHVRTKLPTPPRYTGEVPWYARPSGFPPKAPATGAYYAGYGPERETE